MDHVQFELKYVNMIVNNGSNVCFGIILMSTMLFFYRPEKKEEKQRERKKGKKTFFRSVIMNR
jgi:hypothetical protein